MAGYLVKRAASGMLMASPYKKYRMAYNAGAYAYANRRQIYGAVKTIGRTYRRYRKRKYSARRRERKINFNPPNNASGANTAKSRFVTNNSTLQTYMSRTQNLLVNLAEIPHTTANDTNQRQRNMVNLRGFKVCMEVENTSTRPLYFNIAIVVPKSQGNVTTDDFFRQRDGSRGQDFNTVNLSSLELHCLPINVDKYHVLCHKRFLLNRPAAGASLNREFGSSFKTIMFYQKYNRQVRYAENADTVPEGGRPVMLHWAAQWGEPENTTATNSYDALHKIVTYFREPKC